MAPRQTYLSGLSFISDRDLFPGEWISFEDLRLISSQELTDTFEFPGSTTACFLLLKGIDSC